MGSRFDLVVILCRRWPATLDVTSAAIGIADEECNGPAAQLFLGGALHFGDKHMQDTSHLIRNLLLVALISSGGPIAGCTIDKDDDDDGRRGVFHEDRLEDEDAEDADD